MIFFQLFQPHGDFTVYWEAAWMILHKMNPYSGILSSVFPYNYPPSSFLFIFPLGLLTFIQAGVIWNWASLGALVLSIYLIYKIAQKKFSLPVFGFYVFLFTVPYFPVKFDLGMGQINHFILLFCCLSLYLYERNHKSFAALSLAYAIGIKLAPIVFIFYFIIKKDWSQVIRVVLWTLIIFLLPILLVPIWMQQIYFTKVFFLSWTLAAKDWYYNQSLEGFLARSFQSPLGIIASTYLLTGLILVSTWFRGLKINCRRQMAAVSCLYLLIHPIALQHYFGFAIIPFILISAEFADSKAKRWEWILLGASYVLLAINIKTFDFWPREINFALSHQFYGILLLWLISLFRERLALVLLIILSLAPIITYSINLLCHAKICF